MTASPSYRFIACDLVTSVALAELPVNSVSFGDIRNGAGALTVTILLGELRGTEAATVVAATRPGRTIVHVERDGVFLGGGWVIWGRTYKSATHTLTLTGAGSWSYLRRRVIPATRSFTATEQTDIAATLIGEALADGGWAATPVAWPWGPTVARDRTYYDYEAKFVGEAVEQLADVINGFDFAMISERDPVTGLIAPAWHCWYPRRGLAWQDRGHVLELGRNLADLDWVESYGEQATRVTVQGAGEGEAMARSIRTAPEVEAAGYPRSDAVRPEKDISTLGTLDAHGDRHLATYAWGETSPVTTVTAGTASGPRPGDLVCGDEVLVRIPGGVDPMWPETVESPRRVVGWTVKLNANGVEDLDLDLDDVMEVGA